jgi:predicted nucleic acid-binding protein
MIHLDTSFLIRALVPGSAQGKALVGWMRAGEPVALSAVAWTEFACGPVSPTVVEHARSLFGEPVPFEGVHADLAATLFNASGRRRGSLADCMVAATAMRETAALATVNSADFKRFVTAGLVLA